MHVGGAAMRWQQATPGVLATCTLRFHDARQAVDASLLPICHSGFFLPFLVCFWPDGHKQMSAVSWPSITHAIGIATWPQKHEKQRLDYDIPETQWF